MLLALIACSCIAIVRYPLCTILAKVALPGQGLDLFWQTMKIEQAVLVHWVIGHTLALGTSWGCYRRLVSFRFSSGISICNTHLLTVFCEGNPSNCLLL